MISIITDENDYILLSDYAEKMQLTNISYKILYTGDNYKFFAHNIFSNKQDVLEKSHTLKDINSRKLFNMNFFGKLKIFADGSVFNNLFKDSIANINNTPLYDIVYNELKTKKSWFDLRDKAPCNNCIFQWICPSISSIEYAIGRFNLCHYNSETNSWQSI